MRQAGTARLPIRRIFPSLTVADYGILNKNTEKE